ncbi:hypothetical protein NPIL_56791 [Nephila pilipes]|uniref:SWIM-type domain-containing protein n=1 Tax=Nephila pilipes TaxID=299642 RepID=A0A8X6NX41_NEPPI|nr:hypothetical protein NPIL_56791 [Nephila pilipes]
MADIFQQELDSSEGQENLNENSSTDENIDSNDDKGGDAKDQRKGDMSNELDIEFESFFCPETPSIEELANSDYIHNSSMEPTEICAFESVHAHFFEMVVSYSCTCDMNKYLFPSGGDAICSHITPISCRRAVVGAPSRGFIAEGSLATRALKLGKKERFGVFFSPPPLLPHREIRFFVCLLLCFCQWLGLDIDRTSVKKEKYFSILCIFLCGVFPFLLSGRRVLSIYFPMITNRWGGITLYWVEMPALDRPSELDVHIATDFEGLAHCCIKNDVEGGKFASNRIILRAE